MTTSRARLRQHVTRIARETGQHPVAILSLYADKLRDNPAALAEVHAEVDALLSRSAYREFAAPY